MAISLYISGRRGDKGTVDIVFLYIWPWKSVIPLWAHHSAFQPILCDRDKYKWWPKKAFLTRSSVSGETRSLVWYPTGGITLMCSDVCTFLPPCWDNVRHAYSYKSQLPFMDNPYLLLVGPSRIWIWIMNSKRDSWLCLLDHPTLPSPQLPFSSAGSTRKIDLYSRASWTLLLRLDLSEVSTECLMCIQWVLSSMAGQKLSISHHV